MDKIGKQKVWRYMRVVSFLQILQENGLWFTRLAALQDKYEGERPHAVREHNDRILIQFAEYDKRDADQTKEAFSSFLNNERMKKCINCWHLNEFESAAMWSLYSSESGVAIQSTVARLELALRGRSDIAMGLVQYADFDAKNLLSCDPIYLKRESFSHEKELRLVIEKADTAAHHDGLLVSVDVSELVERVYVSPVALPWTAQVVRQEMKKYDLDKEVIQSSLYSRELK